MARAGSWTPSGNQKFQLREKGLRRTAELLVGWGTFFLILTAVEAVILSWNVSSSCIEVLSIERCEGDVALFIGLSVGLAVADGIVLVPLYFGTARILGGLADAQNGFYVSGESHRLSQSDE